MSFPASATRAPTVTSSSLQDVFPSSVSALPSGSPCNHLSPTLVSSSPTPPTPTVTIPSLESSPDSHNASTSDTQSAYSPTTTHNDPIPDITSDTQTDFSPIATHNDLTSDTLSISSPPNSQPSSTPLSTIHLPASSSTQIITRSMTNSSKPKHFPDYHLYFSTKYPLQALSTITLPLEPHTYKEAVKNQDWLDAMQAEYNALLANKTWTLCPRPCHKKVVRNKWVFKLKQKSDGNNLKKKKKFRWEY